MSEEVKIDAKRVQAITNMGKLTMTSIPWWKPPVTTQLKSAAVTISWSTPKTSTIIRS